MTILLFDLADVHPGHRFVGMQPINTSLHDQVQYLPQVAIGVFDERQTVLVDDLLTIEGVKSAENVTGPFEVIAVVEVDDTPTLGKLLVSKIETIKGITGTLTCVVT